MPQVTNSQPAHLREQEPEDVLLTWIIGKLSEVLQRPI